MDFGEILSEWENYKKKRKSTERDRVKQELERWLESHPDELERYKKEKEREEINDRILAVKKRERLRKMSPERVLDLHGYRVKEAEETIHAFIRDCKRSGIKKVLIIHGKGKHTKGEPVLKNTVIKTLEKEPLAGEFGVADREYGGKGALWLIIR